MTGSALLVLSGRRFVEALLRRQLAAAASAPALPFPAGDRADSRREIC